MDKLSAMQAYCRIVERGSIAQAAEDLGVSPGLLSRELKLLEASLGSTLLNRTTRRMSLTEAGRSFYEDALHVLSEVRRMEDRAREGAGRVQGLLRINAPHSFGTMVLSPILPAFRARHPDLRLSISFDDHVVDMIEGGYDLSIRIRAALPDSGLMARRIGSVRQGLFASPGYLEAHGVPQDPADLARHDLIAYRLADSPGKWELRHGEETATVPLPPDLVLGSSLALRDVLIAGQGIGALPDFLSAPPVADGALVPVLPHWHLPERSIYAVTAARDGVNAGTRAFVEALRAALR